MDHAGDVLYYIAEALNLRMGSLDTSMAVMASRDVQGAFGWGQDQPFVIVAVSLDTNYQGLDDKAIAMVVEVLERLRDQGP